MQAAPSVALIVFSNDLDSYLPNVETEKRLIEEALEHYNDTNRLKVITRSSVSIDDIFRLFNRYKNRIVLFHFAGHAGGNGLQLNNTLEKKELGRAEGLAELFGREATKGQLKLVFLNGCSTEPQVARLKEVGVPSIIGTHYPISDSKAVRFAKYFYRTLTNADQANPFEMKNPTIQEAFEAGMGFLKTGYPVKEKPQTRGFTFEFEEEELDEPWELFTTIPNWSLPNTVSDEEKIFNEYLTRNLVESLVPYSRPAAKFLPIANSKIPDWETHAKISNKAKEIIVRSFVGLVGIQLRQLFAIGKEDLSKSKQRRYVQTTLNTAKLTLKILCYTLLSELWDLNKASEVSTYKLTTNQKEIIQRFFEENFGFDIEDVKVTICFCCNGK